MHFCLVWWKNKPFVVAGACSILLMLVMVQISRISTSTWPMTEASKSSQFTVQHRFMKSDAFHHQIFTSFERWIELAILRTMDKVLQHYNVTYFMYGGTLLGSHRHMGLIPWDDDIDILMNITCSQQLPDMLRRMAPSLSFIKHNTIGRVFHSKSRRMCQSCNWRWPYLDIIYFAENSTHIWDTTVSYRRRYVYPKSLTLPTHPRPLEHLWLPAPRDTLAFLQLTYGWTSTCVTWPLGYSHMLHETKVRSQRRPCRELRDRLPFVHRRPCSAATGSGIRSGDACILETLQLESDVLRSEVIAEPSFAISEPFGLRLKDGFSQPKHYPDTNVNEIM